MRERRVLCEGQFIIIWTPAGHQDWTLNKLCQDICSKLASLAALHKQKSAGVQHVERLPNRVINLYKQKNLPNKHISSHRAPGYKAELSCKLMHISRLLQSLRKAQAAYRREHRKLRVYVPCEEQWNRTDLFSHDDDDVVLLLLRQHAWVSRDGQILKWLGSRNMAVFRKIFATLKQAHKTMRAEDDSRFKVHRDTQISHKHLFSLHLFDDLSIN